MSAPVPERIEWYPTDTPPQNDETVVVVRNDGIGIDLAYYEDGSWYLADSLGEIELNDVQWWSTVEGPP